jgi:predicted Rossmann fold nucleotide-binding protein DprA/Smf involved in DNA uptake
LATQPRINPTFVDPREVLVWNALDNAATSLDELCARVALPVAQCMSTVTTLELRGIVECGMTGDIRRRV